jgi:hypothetical protein
MITVHTRETLSALSWDEIRKLHASLGLKATADSRTRRDYENRILEVQPQKVEEPIAPQPIASQLEQENEPATSPALSTLPKIWDKVSSEVAIGEYIGMPYHPLWVVAGKTLMDDGRIRLVVRTPAGSQVEEWYLPAPAPLVKPVEEVWSLDQIEEAIASLKDDILNPKKLLDRPVRTECVDRETITWKTPFQGEILGREEKSRPFFIEGDCIYVVLQSGTKNFCASERAHRNYHHTVIRQAVEAGKRFDPLSKIGELCRFGRIHQSCDGWWWVWRYGQARGHKFLTRSMALKYLEMKSVKVGAGDRVASVAG